MLSKGQSFASSRPSLLPLLKESSKADLPRQISIKCKRSAQTLWQKKIGIFAGLNNQQDVSKQIESISELIKEPPKIDRNSIRLQKIKTQSSEEKSHLTVEEAEIILKNEQKQPQEKSQACKVIAESYLKRAYGNELPKIQFLPHLKHTGNSNKLNTNILSQILNEIQHNSRSHSIIIRKSELEQIREQYLKGRQTKQKGSRFKPIINQEQRMEILYELKNQYRTLQELIITTKCDRFYDFMREVSQTSESRSGLRQTFKSSRGGNNFKKTFILTGIEKENKDFIDETGSSKELQIQQIKRSMKKSSFYFKDRKFQLQTDRFVMQNFSQTNPKMFLFVMYQCRFQTLKVIILKYLKIDFELIFFFLDCMRHIGSAANKMELFQFSYIKMENISKQGDKLAEVMAFVPIKCLKMEFLDLGNRQIAKICQALDSNHIIEEISLRNNKIDILGLRHIEFLCRKHPTLKQVDLRNNQIPHYANLKDKTKIIQFF